MNLKTLKFFLLKNKKKNFFGFRNIDPFLDLSIWIANVCFNFASLSALYFILHWIFNILYHSTRISTHITFFSIHFILLTSASTCARLPPQVIFSACEQGVFDLLLQSQKSLSAAEVAQELGTSVDGMERLLDVLVGVEVLEVELTDGTGMSTPGESNTVYRWFYCKLS